MPSSSGRAINASFAEISDDTRIEPLVDRLYPRTFTYHRGDGHPDETHPLFGDLVDAVRHAIDTEADARSSGDGSPLGSFDGRNYFPGTHARRHASTKSVAGSLSSIQSRKSLRLPSLISRRTESPATIKARAADERGRLSPHSTSGTTSGSRLLPDARFVRKLGEACGDGPPRRRRHAQPGIARTPAVGVSPALSPQEIPPPFPPP